MNENNYEENDDNNEKLIKIYKRALHVLRKAIRSYQKRNKTFNPDYELKNAFDKWASLTFNNDKDNVNVNANVIVNDNEEEEKNNDD